MAETPQEAAAARDALERRRTAANDTAFRGIVMLVTGVLTAVLAVALLLLVPSSLGMVLAAITGSGAAFTSLAGAGMVARGLTGRQALTKQIREHVERHQLPEARIVERD